MKQLAENIVAIIQDYHNHHGFQFTTDHVIEWVNQFEAADRTFILQELLHLLRQGIYVSATQARKLLLQRIASLSQKYKFTNPVSFLANTEFLALQPADKSQSVLLTMLDEEMQLAYGISIAHCGTASKKYALYIDDVLATGGTVFNDCMRWLQTSVSEEETNLDKVLKEEKILIVSVFCLHNWNNVRWRLKIVLKNESILKKIQLLCDYEIQNHPTFLNQRFNFTYPVAAQPQSVLDYFNSLEAASNEKTAFRKADQPAAETFFSSPANRVRFENILLQKGIDLLQNATILKPNHRPLGATFPSYKTLGTGTLFFTWRNIPNTSPVVFWWSSANWNPLFPLHRRGLAI